MAHRTLPTDYSYLDHTGIAYSVVPRHAMSLYHQPRSHSILTGSMEQDQRLWISVVLQAVAEQDPEFATTNLSGEAGKRKRLRLSKAATEYVASPGFEEDCDKAGLPVAYMRSCSPAKAKEALTKVLTGESRLNLSAEEPLEEDLEEVAVDWAA